MRQGARCGILRAKIVASTLLGKEIPGTLALGQGCEDLGFRAPAEGWKLDLLVLPENFLVEERGGFHQWGEA